MNDYRVFPKTETKSDKESTTMALEQIRENALSTTTRQGPVVSVPQVYIPTDEDWKFMLSWGQSAMKSRMLPTAIQSPEAAAVIVLKGRELGISFMTAIAHIHVINGKPTMSAELIQAMARRNLPGLVINILESDSKVAKIEFIRPERGAKPFIQSFTIEEAQAAKLTGKDVWKSYPAAMLWSRCVTAGLRKVCPEALMGVSYTPEEMGAEVDQEGNVIETTGRHVNESHSAPKEDKTSKALNAAADAAEKAHQEQEQKRKLSAEVGAKIKKLKQELELSDEEIRAEAHRLCGKDDPKKMTLAELQELVKVLEDEKNARETETESTKTETDPNWGKDVSAGIQTEL